jgi:uncharacterized membrane protein YhaH (DUF805 family)
MNVSWYPEVLKKYAKFEGRAGREEFWVYALFNFLIFFGFYIIAFVSRAPILMVLYWLFTLAVLPASLAVGTRRLHDTGRSGWYLLLEFVPFGAIVLIVFWAEAGRFGPNAYGAGAPTTPGEPAPSAPRAAPWAAPVALSAPSAPPISAARLVTSSAAPAPGTATPAFCAQCGTSLRHGATFCTSCGARAEAW